MLIDPCIPDTWDGYSVDRVFRGKNLHIEVRNPEHVCKGIAYIVVNGEKLDSAVIPVSKLKDGDNMIEAVMGAAAQKVVFERL
jgi:cellobiose phosphorylase